VSLFAASLFDAVPSAFVVSDFVSLFADAPAELSDFPFCA